MGPGLLLAVRRPGVPDTMNPRRIWTHARANVLGVLVATGVVLGLGVVGRLFGAEIGGLVMVSTWCAAWLVEAKRHRVAKGDQRYC